MMDSWGEGRSGLFDALAKVCESINDEKAGELAHSIATRAGKSYAAELGQLRKKAAEVEDLQKENTRLQTELRRYIKLPTATADAAVINLSERSDSCPPISHPESKSTAIIDGSARPAPSISCSFSGLDEEGPSIQPITAKEFSHARDNEIPGGRSGSTRDLICRYNDMYLAWKRAVDARKVIADKWKGDVSKWIRYTNVLERQLESHGVPLPHDAKRQDTPHLTGDLATPAAIVAELGENTAINRFVEAPMPLTASGKGGAGRLRSRSHGNTNFEGDTLVGTPDVPSNASPTETIDLPPLIWDKTTGQAGSDPPQTSHHSSSTQGDVDEALEAGSNNVKTVYVKAESRAESPSDLPIVISSRMVRKPRSYQASDLAATPLKHKIKIEQDECGIFPIGSGRSGSLDLHESMDLDEVGEKVDTPKKRRRLLGATKAKAMSNELGPPVKDGLHDRPSRGLTSALQPKSPNKQTLPRTSDSTRSVKRRRLEDRLSGADLFAEDGENRLRGNGLHTPSQGHTTVRLAEGAKKHRPLLDKLLNVPPPRQQPLTPGAGSKGQNAAALQTTPTGRLILSEIGQKHPASSKNATSRTAAAVSNRTPSALQTSLRRGTKDELTVSEANDPEHEPFRARPLRRLGLEHFKINSNANQGYDYAYADVVRGKEQRKCLPGCTKPECCGNAFRKIAEMTMVAADGDLTPSQEERDLELLEDFLGGNKEKLKTMSKKEMRELLIQAKARDLAKKHGKHRATFERRRSPPGFWRADFPTTQEEAEDRAEAQRVERELVETRYNEAMREGGAWRFRDE